MWKSANKHLMWTWYVTFAAEVDLGLFSVVFYPGDWAVIRVPVVRTWTLFGVESRSEQGKITKSFARRSSFITRHWPPSSWCLIMASETPETLPNVNVGKIMSSWSLKAELNMSHCRSGLISDSDKYKPRPVGWPWVSFIWGILWNNRTRRWRRAE